jgi:predicted AAA+ superfamily ATPase
MQKRKIESVLVEWKTSGSKKPLVIKGIRLCGKRCFVPKNAEENYECVVYMNFILEPYKKSGRGRWCLLPDCF